MPMKRNTNTVTTTAADHPCQRVFPQSYTILTAADGGFLGSTRLLASAQGLPVEHKGSQVRAEEDADNDVSVVVHGEQHDKVSHSELHHVQKRADRLLTDVGAEGRDANGAGGSAVGGLAAIRASSIVANRRRRTLELGDVLADDVAVEFLDGAAESFEGHDKEEDADAGSGEHALGSDVPRGGDETRIDGVPVPKHL